MSDLEVTPGMVDELVGTRPWVLFLAFFLGLAATCMVCGGIAVSIAGLASGEAEAIVIGPIYLVLAAFYAVPCYYMVQFAQAVAVLRAAPSIDNLTTAMAAQMKFWRLVGILTLVFVGLYLALIVFVVILGGIGAMSGLS